MKVNQLTKIIKFFTVATSQRDEALVVFQIVAWSVGIFGAAYGFYVASETITTISLWVAICVLLVAMAIKGFYPTPKNAVEEHLQKIRRDTGL